MTQRAIINQILEDMDEIRPIVLAAMPEDQVLRARTRRIITDLETLKLSPVVPIATYLWLCQMTSKLLDVEHGAMLRPTPDGYIPKTAKEPIKNHIEQRRMLLMQALQDIPAIQIFLDRSSALIGNKARRDESLQGRARHHESLLKEHLQQDTEFREELQQLIEAFTPTLSAISSVLEQAGEESPELKAVKKILAQDLPDNIEDARSVLQQARLSILSAGAKLANASVKLNETIQDHVDQLSAMSSKLQQAESDARNDPLTGLPNRRYLAEFLNTLGSSNYCFLVIDIDHFKNINDTYGHDVGDEILQQLATMLKESTRNTDLAARIGGEEFTVVFPETGIENSFRLAETLRQTVETQPFSTQQGSVNITISIGIAEHVANQANAHTFKAADKALYESKHEGRNRVTIASTVQN